MDNYIITIASLVVNLYFCQGYAVLHLYKFSLWIYYNIRNREIQLCPDKKSRRVISWILDAIITQIIGWCSVTLLVTSVLNIPFQIPDPTTLHHTQTLLAIFIGKHSYKCFHELLVRLNITHGIYHAILFSSSLALSLSETNCFVALLTITMELADFPLLIRRILTEHQIPQYQRRHVYIASFALVTAVVIRGVFFVVVLCYAFWKKSPLVLGHIDLSAFCFLTSFIVITNIWAILYGIMRLQKVTMINKLHQITSSKLRSVSETNIAQNKDFTCGIKDNMTEDQHAFYKHILLLAKDAYKSFLKSKLSSSEDNRTSPILFTNIVQASNESSLKNGLIDHV